MISLKPTDKRRRVIRNNHVETPCEGHGEGDADLGGKSQAAPKTIKDKCWTDKFSGWNSYFKDLPLDFLADHNEWLTGRKPLNPKNPKNTNSAVESSTKAEGEQPVLELGDYFSSYRYSHVSSILRNGFYPNKPSGFVPDSLKEALQNIKSRVVPADPDSWGVQSDADEDADEDSDGGSDGGSDGDSDGDGHGDGDGDGGKGRKAQFRFPPGLTDRFRELYGSPTFIEAAGDALEEKEGEVFGGEEILEVVRGDLDLDDGILGDTLTGAGLSGATDVTFDFPSYYNLLTSYCSVELSLMNFLTADKLRRVTALHLARHLAAYATIPRRLKTSPQLRRDRGWTRPRILILTATRRMAKDWMENICQILSASGEDSVRGYGRFLVDFSATTEDGEVDVEAEMGLPMIQNPRGRRKPLDFIERFRGNRDEDFAIGLRVPFGDPSFGGAGGRGGQGGQGGAGEGDAGDGEGARIEGGGVEDAGLEDAGGAGILKIVQNLHSADVIIASPLGLLEALAVPDPDAAPNGANGAHGANVADLKSNASANPNAKGKVQGKAGEKAGDKAGEKAKGNGESQKAEGVPGVGEVDNSILSSIEVMVVDAYDCLERHNIDHLRQCMELCNQYPLRLRQGVRVDFSRLRRCYYAEKGKNFSANYRQTIALGDGCSMLIKAYMNLYDANFRGMVELGRMKTGIAASIIAKKTQNHFFFYKVAPEGSQKSQQAQKSLILQNSEDDLPLLYDQFRNHFIEGFHPKLINDQCLVVAPSWLEFIELQDLLKAGMTTALVKGLHEQSRSKHVGKCLKGLREGECPVLLATERYGWYHDGWFEGAQHLFFVSPPRTVSTMLRMLEGVLSNPRGVGSESGAYKGTQICVIYFDPKIHFFELERIFGTKRATELVENSRTNLLTTC